MKHIAIIYWRASAWVKVDFHRPRTLNIMKVYNILVVLFGLGMLLVAAAHEDDTEDFDNVEHDEFLSRWDEERSAGQETKSYFCPECAKSLINAKFGLRIRVKGKIDLPSGTIFGRPAIGGTSVVIRRKPCDLLPMVNGGGRRYKPVCVIGREGQMCYGKPRCTAD